MGDKNGQQRKISKLKEEEYQKYFGVKKEIFEKMLEVLNDEYAEKHKKGGRPSVLSVLDKLVTMLQYYREYRSMDNIAFDYKTNKSTVYYAITWAEETLVKNDTFHLLSRKKLLEDKTIENVVVEPIRTPYEQ